MTNKKFKVIGNFELEIEANNLNEAEEKAFNLNNSEIIWEDFRVEEIR